MREIKFRAWDKTLKKFWDADIQVDAEGAILEMNSDEESIWYEPTDNFELTWYTGLKDKNGKEIYEGDIVSMPYNRYPQNWEVEELSAYGLYFQRITNKPFSAPHHYRDLRHTGQMEVIGNIYENQGLLK